MVTHVLFSCHPPMYTSSKPSPCSPLTYRVSARLCIYVGASTAANCWHCWLCLYQGLRYDLHLMGSFFFRQWFKSADVLKNISFSLLKNDEFENQNLLIDSAQIKTIVIGWTSITKTCYVYTIFKCPDFKNVVFKIVDIAAWNSPNNLCSKFTSNLGKSGQINCAE